VSASVLADAFAHHTWATLRVIDACDPLTDEQLATTVPGTFGSILETMRHTVGADSWYLFRLGAIEVPISAEDEAALDLAGMRGMIERHADRWSGLLATDPDPDEVVPVRRDDGSETHAPVGIRLAQALHHGTDHRSQICTALTALGIEPPEVDLWAFGVITGRVTEISG
jgi:uncharacterized damage-inducible protein DinB